MATVRRTPLSPYWQAVLTLENGSRTNRSTKIPATAANRKKAQDIADALEHTFKAGRDGTLVEGQLLKTFNELMGRIGQEPVNNETVEDYLRQWLKGKNNENTQDRYRRAVELFLEFLGKKADNKLGSITSKDILDYRSHRENQGMASKTVRVEIKALNNAFNIARKSQIIERNPIEKALMITPLVTESSVRDKFTDEQVILLLSVATGDWKTMVLLGYYTGARIGDCADMRWNNIKQHDGLNLLEYLPQKNQKAGKKPKQVVLPIHSCLMAHLETLPNFTPNDPLCPTLEGKGTGGAHGLSSLFGKLLKQAGIDAGVIQGQGRRKFSQLSFHSFRKTFISNLANKNVNSETRMALTGHENDAVHSGYTHLDLAKLNSAVATLSSLVVR